MPSLPLSFHYLLSKAPPNTKNEAPPTITMRILLLTPGFAASEQDYNCIPPMQLFVRTLQKKGMDVHIVAFEYPFRDDPQDWHGISVISANGQNRRWLRWRTWSRVFRYAEQIIQTQKIDIIHSFGLKAAQVAVAGARILPHQGGPMRDLPFFCQACSDHPGRP